MGKQVAARITFKKFYQRSEISIMLRFLMTDKTFSQKSNTSVSQIYYKLYLENFIQNDDKIIEYLIRQSIRW